MGLQKPLYLASQLGIAAAGLVQIDRPLRHRFLLERLEEDLFHLRQTAHRVIPIPKGHILDATPRTGFALFYSCAASARAADPLRRHDSVPRSRSLGQCRVVQIQREAVAAAEVPFVKQIAEGREHHNGRTRAALGLILTRVSSHVVFNATDARETPHSF